MVKVRNATCSLVCDVCHEGFFKTKKTLRQHKANKHETRGTTECTVCHAVLKRKNLRVHIAAKHRSESRPKKRCHYCGISMLAESLQKHREKSCINFNQRLRDERTCRGCNKIFKKSGNFLSLKTCVEKNV